MNDPGAALAALFARACTLGAQGDLPAAGRQLRDVLAQAPLQVEALRLLARCYDRTGRGEDAIVARRLAESAEVAQGLRAAAALAGTPDRDQGRITSAAPG